MKKILPLILIACCFFIACKKSSDPAPVAPAKQLQIVISKIATTLTIYSFSVVNQKSDTLINIYSQLENNTYKVNVKHGDLLQLNYFLELEGLPAPVEPELAFIYDGATMLTVKNNAGVVKGSQYIVIP